MMLNRAIVLGVAWQIHPTSAYRDAAIASIDYVLGRNALDQSYVTGFGVRTMRHPHHRFWAVMADPRYPAPPSGVLSGGPNLDEARRPGPMQGRAAQV
jgi:endoglucanase